jgi:hypothetical protein
MEGIKEKNLTQRRRERQGAKVYLNKTFAPLISLRLCVKQIGIYFGMAKT